MKIGILTHYSASSHGALLQMYCLQSVLEKLGYEVSILTYNRNYDFVDENTKKRFSTNIKNLPYYLLSYARENGFGSLVYQFNKQRVLNKFKKSNFKFEPYINSEKFDVVVVGADEVFSLENGINFMMFGHGITSKRIISYAPSFGQTDLNRIKKYGCSELIKSGLKRFKSLSARDEGTKGIIDVLLNQNTPIVCDPALLYDFPHPQKESVKKKYIVIYSYQSNFKDKERIKCIKDYAKKNDYELWSVGVYYKWCDKKINCNPLEMLKIFANAEAIITDTFHGTISSYISHTPMAIFVRKNNNVKLEHLIKIMGLEKRKIENPRNLEEVLKQPIDFSLIDKTVEKLRVSGEKYLLDSLNK